MTINVLSLILDRMGFCRSRRNDAKQISLQLRPVIEPHTLVIIEAVAESQRVVLEDMEWQSEDNATILLHSYCVSRLLFRITQCMALLQSEQGGLL